VSARAAPPHPEDRARGQERREDAAAEGDQYAVSSDVRSRPAWEVGDADASAPGVAGNSSRTHTNAAREPDRFIMPRLFTPGRAGGAS